MTSAGVKRIEPRKQTLDDAYDPPGLIKEKERILFCYLIFPANFLEIEVCKPITHMDDQGKRYTDYEVRMKTNLPIFKYNLDS